MTNDIKVEFEKKGEGKADNIMVRFDIPVDKRLREIAATEGTTLVGAVRALVNLGLHLYDKADKSDEV